MYSIEYDGLTVTYEIEGDCYGNHANIVNIIGDINYPIDDETIADMKFHCECDFADLQTKHYLKTGETL